MSSSPSFLDPVVLPLVRGSTILDVACGFGRWGCLLRTNFFEWGLSDPPVVDAVDAFAPNVEYVKRLNVYRNVWQAVLPCPLPRDTYTTILASFDNLGSMAALTVSAPHNRWGFATTTLSQFLNAPPTVGLCDATFTTQEEVRILAIDYDGPTVTIRFPTVAGRRYRLQWAVSLAANHWDAASQILIGSGRIDELTDAQATGQPGRFYRVSVEP